MTSMLEFDHLLLSDINTLYYVYWREKEEDSKLSKEEKGARQVGRMIEDNLT